MFDAFIFLRVKSVHYAWKIQAIKYKNHKHFKYIITFKKRIKVNRTKLMFLTFRGE